jgi:hypothetical protein
MKANTKRQYYDPVVKLEKAVKAAGNKNRLSKILNVSRSTVSAWPDVLEPLHAYRIAQVFPEIVENR